MNQAIKILWKSTERNYENAVGGIDYQVLKSNYAFPSSEADFDPTLANPLEETLIMVDTTTESEPDMRSYKAVSYCNPTNVKDQFFTKVNQFQTSTHYEFKTVDELVVAIKQREQEANNRICFLADFAKLSMINSPIMTKGATGVLTAKEQEVYDRTLEVQAIAVDNDTNARRLIDIAVANAIPDAIQQAFDLNSGWKESGITPLDIPFNELMP